MVWLLCFYSVYGILIVLNYVLLIYLVIVESSATVVMSAILSKFYVYLLLKDNCFDYQPENYTQVKFLLNA